MEYTDISGLVKMCQQDSRTSAGMNNKRCEKGGN